MRLAAPARPLSWLSGNVVYARHLADPWALFALPCRAYAEAPLSVQQQACDDVRDFCAEIGHDFQLLRVTRAFDEHAYRRELGASATADPGGALRETYLAEQLACLEPGREPLLYIAVSLSEPRQHRSELVSGALTDPGEPLRGLRDRLGELGLGSPRQLAWERLEADHVHAIDLLDAKVAPYFPGARPVTLAELEWLVRRAWTRGLGEPTVDGGDQPQAVVVERNGRAVLELDFLELLRWSDYVHRRHRHLEVIGELGSGVQAGLVAQRLPGRAYAPSRVLELLFRPAEQLAFGIDVCVNARWVTNARALAEIENKITEADSAAEEEHASQRGLSDETDERTSLARDARAYFNDGHPRLDVTLSVLCAAADQPELAWQIEETRRTFARHDVVLRQPPAQQLEVFFSQLPAQRSWVTGYTRHATPEQLGALGATAAHRVGGSRGWILGRISSPAGRVVRWDPAEASRANVAAGVLFLGDSGAGKTVGAAKLAIEAFLDGAVIVDCTHKSDDHRWHTHPAISPHAQELVLDDRPEQQGRLDPWRNAPAKLRVDAAHDFLLALLPERYGPDWETRLTQAISAVDERARTDARHQPSNSDVLRALRDRGDETAIAVAEHLEAAARHSLAQLGFAEPGAPALELGRRRVTVVVCEHIPLPRRGIGRDQYHRSERIGAALLRLLALSAFGVMSEHPDALKLFIYDEAHVLTSSDVGRATLEEMQRLGRSKRVVPLLGTQNASDVGVDQGSVPNLFGSIFAYRAPNRPEAERALALMDVEPTEQRVTRLLALRDGQALLKDHAGQVEFVDVTLPPSWLERVRTDTRPAADEHAHAA